ncbi:hypothetical protein WKH56_20280 [Priestia sp. SB1]|uniref:hypothetical protein n=1 Tax=Priestia sp. SB1 TaxID=3132359 RepID=UPI00316FB16F
MFDAKLIKEIMDQFTYEETIEVFSQVKVNKEQKEIIPLLELILFTKEPVLEKVKS